MKLDDKCNCDRGKKIKAFLYICDERKDWYGIDNVILDNQKLPLKLSNDTNIDEYKKQQHFFIIVTKEKIGL